MQLSISLLLIFHARRTRDNSSYMSLSSHRNYDNDRQQVIYAIESRNFLNVILRGLTTRKISSWETRVVAAAELDESCRRTRS